MTTANGINISRVALLQTPSSAARHLNRAAVMVLGLLFYGLVTTYLLIGTAALWTASRPADAPFAIPAPVMLEAATAEDAADQVPSRPQPGFAPR